VRPAGVLEWIAIVIASLAISFGAIALLSGFFAGRVAAGVSGNAGAPGVAFADLGHAHVQPGQAHPPYNSDPPTSGAHVVVPVTADGGQLSNDQLLEALELGDVVVMYGSPAPPPGLQALVSQVAYRFTPALAAVGQAVVLARRPGTPGLIGLAWAHMLRVGSPKDPLLRTFLQYWLGRGAPRK
jgi:hypothetical protein